MQDHNALDLVFEDFVRGRAEKFFGAEAAGEDDDDDEADE